MVHSDLRILTGEKKSLTVDQKKKTEARVLHFQCDSFRESSQQRSTSYAGVVVDRPNAGRERRRIFLRGGDGFGQVSGRRNSRPMWKMPRSAQEWLRRSVRVPFKRRNETVGSVR